jgi:hypothetical protein
MADYLSPQEQRSLRQVVARASEQGWGIAVGLVFGLGLMLATLVLVIRGGETPGAHLGLLSVYFPGYRVTTLGAFIGFVYGFVAGYAAGRCVATFYNWLGPRN